ncbi:MAG: 16S rRNA (adenine(1518)-N(6)/adenine(1519)-N(6))-dimethyltransferase RsmA [Oscillospiraceae bacterium]|jgi:16S rRNA (adenine1518-N6/adenine1519-N6)-dimethyltransferase|nr:16S rRNA (adenine(1518)-N(6)/adenine(1519)-N(6))-dimethyltransferase RsmA [Oscillospiraceae bacterium]
MIDVCNPNQMQYLLKKYGFHFTKSKGQNFLTSRWVPQEIVRASGMDAHCGVLEIGPGFGPLTQELCLAASKVLALEVDTSLRPVLNETVGNFDNLEILFTDALKADLPALVSSHFAGLRPVACANLPYYITSPVLSKLLESRVFERVTVMVQREVALRICASPGASDYSAFTVFCNYHAAPTLLFDVPPDCFMPQPKVTSAVVQLETRSAPPAEIADEAMFFRVVRASFAQRRKTLLNTLCAAFSQLSKQELSALIASCGISPTVRGETLDIAAFARLSNALFGRLQHV